jgi:galactose mutarotase-like enzyme
MSFSQREERRGDRLLDVLTDDDAGLRLIISRLGAEPVSLARRSKSGDWIGFLYRDNDVSAPAKGWANHATVMGYFLHRLKDGHSLYRGREIKGGTHSFLRSKTWHLVPGVAGDGSLTYRITPNDFSATEYPLRVSLDLVYKMDGETVTVEFRFKNDEPELTAHVVFGLHPGFAANSFDSFEFTMPAGKYRRYFSPDNYLSGETEEIDFAGGKMLFCGRSCLIIHPRTFDVPARDSRVSRSPEHTGDHDGPTGVPFLTLWSDGGRFCVEPCWGLTDAHQQRARG